MNHSHDYEHRRQRRSRDDDGPQHGRLARLPSALPSAATMLTAITVMCAIGLGRATSTAADRINTRGRRGGRDRGASAIEWAAIVVGVLLIAAAVLAAVRDAGEEITSNICTNADPSTC